MNIKKKILNFTSQGQGICEENGLKVFVDNALPDEEVLIEIREKKKNYAKASLLKVLWPSVHRIAPICAHYNTCGGCQLMHLKYEGQLQFKRQKVMDALERIGGFKDINVEATIPSPKEHHYRNKIQMPVIKTEGGFEFGLYEKHSNNIVPIQKCHLHTKLSEEVFGLLKTLISNYENRISDLRHILIKSSVNFDECLLIFITRGKNTKVYKELATEIMNGCKYITGVIENINHKRENSILGDKYQLLSGKPYLYEKLLGMTFQISTHSFFQVNPYQAEKLYSTALEMANIKSSDIILDAYCGIGTLSLIASPYALRVYGIEVVADAIEDAKKNAALNNIGNTHFMTGMVEELISKIPKVDIAFINPPRKGCEESVLKEISDRGLKKLIYISCDPASLSRDLKYLCSRGYTIEKVQPIDMFPQTIHVETVVLLTQ